MADTRVEMAFGDLLSALAHAYAQGMASGNMAASADNPAFLGNKDMISAAWEVSCGQSCGQAPAEQEEYFVGWVHGYVVRAEQIEGPPALWEDAVEGDDLSSPIVSGPGRGSLDNGVSGARIRRSSRNDEVGNGTSTPRGGTGHRGGPTAPRTAAGG